MKLIKELDIRKVGKRGYRFGLFFCPVCEQEVEKIKKDGVNALQCSRKCYAKTRTGVRRGAYLDFIISNNYRYRYAPEHPNARGTKKLYVLEHRLVMESVIGRLLTEDEVVHHKDENTLNNSPDNLEVMTNSEHSRLHRKLEKERRNANTFEV